MNCGCFRTRTARVMNRDNAELIPLDGDTVVIRPRLGEIVVGSRVAASKVSKGSEGFVHHVG
jgi:formylmethanofuran dehydrogenase subunit D